MSSPNKRTLHFLDGFQNIFQSTINNSHSNSTNQLHNRQKKRNRKSKTPTNIQSHSKSVCNNNSTINALGATNTTNDICNRASASQPLNNQPKHMHPATISTTTQDMLNLTTTTTSTKYSSATIVATTKQNTSSSLIIIDKTDTPTNHDHDDNNNTIQNVTRILIHSTDTNSDDGKYFINSTKWRF